MSAGWTALGLILVAAVVSRSSEGSSREGATGEAPRTGATGPDAASAYAREIERLAREELARIGAGDVEQIAGAHAVATVAIAETGGAHEHGNNPGNLRAINDQPRARWPGGDVYRVFPSRVEGVRALVALLRTGARYAPAWRELVALASASEPLEPVIAAWLAAVRARGYTPPAQGETDAQYIARSLRDGERAATFVSRALSTTGAATMPAGASAPSPAAQSASDRIQRALPPMDAGASMDARAMP